MQLLSTICYLRISKYILRCLLKMQQNFRSRYAYVFAKELNYELTADEKDFVYERVPVIWLSRKVSSEL
jgi:hypothetical protein